MSSLPYRRGSFADHVAVALDALAGTVDEHGAQLTPSLDQLEHEAYRWYLDSRPDGYPSRASGAEPSTGRTNVTDDEGVPIPPRSDPTGELVAGRDEDRVFDALVLAECEVRAARQGLENARNRLVAALHPPESLDDARADARSREWCWSCLRGQVFAPVYRERDRSGQRTPLCRSCWEWCAGHGEVFPPVGVVEVWGRGERLTSKVLAEIEATGTTRGKKKRRRAS